MDAYVLKSIRIEFLRQPREGALEDTLNDAIDAVRAKAGPEELEAASGQTSPCYERFVASPNESTSERDDF